jgi:hypothetical protein
MSKTRYDKFVTSIEKLGFNVHRNVHTIDTYLTVLDDNGECLVKIENETNYSVDTSWQRFKDLTIEDVDAARQLYTLVVQLATIPIEERYPSKYRLKVDIKGVNDTYLVYDASADSYQLMEIDFSIEWHPVNLKYDFSKEELYDIDTSFFKWIEVK